VAMIGRVGELAVEVATAKIGSRVAFAESMVDGLTALELKAKSVAAAEVRALTAELIKRV